MKDTMKLPAWPSHVEKNDDFVYIGYRPNLDLIGVLAVGLFPSQNTFEGETLRRDYSGSGSLHYFVKKGDPFLARFAPKKPAHLPPLPKGAVYIGEGGTESHPRWVHGNVLYMDFYYFRKEEMTWDFVRDGWSSGGHIAAQIDSPLHKAQPWYVPNSKKEPKKPSETHKEKDARITALNNEVYALKAKLAECEKWIKSAPKV